jgi:hypothetical protein
MTWDEGTEAIPFATATDLAEAYNLYPHRREVPFILGRMGRLLAFDDQTSNFNLFIAVFLKHLQRDRIIERYQNRRVLERYKGAIDPIIYLTRIIVEARENSRPASLANAICLLNQYRRDDELAEFYRLIYEHEQVESQKANPDQTMDKLSRIRDRIKHYLDEISSQKSPRNHIRLVTSHVFQEILDHYAQLHVELATEKDKDHLLHVIPQLYARILTTRQQISNASDVPWLDGPTKFTIYHYFKHQVGRESDVTRQIMDFLEKVPGLTQVLKKRIADTEAFRHFRNLDTWDRGTPLDANYAGTGMHKKVVEWLKSGW